MSEEIEILCVGFKKWKKSHITPIISLNFSKKIHFFKKISNVKDLAPAKKYQIFFWGAFIPKNLEPKIGSYNMELIRTEDGFIRSIGLGSDFVKPLSLVFDRKGIYFDATKESDLESLLNTVNFEKEEIEEAIKIRELIKNHNITKYNTDPIRPVHWNTLGKKVILVPGQVETDASIKLGCTTIKRNIQLLECVRKSNPTAFIVYKPHPDVLSLNRKGHIFLKEAAKFSDFIEKESSILSCIDAAHEVHTMTSLAGFDALLRDKKVVTYGQPFYAGWGLTEDRAEGATAFLRRTRVLNLDELVAGVLLRYPIYWDWDLKGYTTCEATINTIIRKRDTLEKEGNLKKSNTKLILHQIKRFTRLIQLTLK